MTGAELQERAHSFAREHVRRCRGSKNLLRNLTAWVSIVRLLYADAPEFDIAAIAQRAIAEAPRRGRGGRIHVAESKMQQELLHV